MKQQTEHPDATGAPPAPLIRAMTHMLRPLVRAAIFHGITFPMIAEILKRLYVESAEKDFPIEGAAEKPVSDSRISLLTRVHRKDVKRLRHDHETGTQPSDRDASLAAQLIAKWLASPEYTDNSGKPLYLSRTGKNNSAPSFDALVTSISKDVRPRVLLDELINRNIVSMEPGNLIQLNMQAFVPRKDFKNLTFFYGHNLHDHVAAATHNLLSDQSPFLERCVYYHDLTPESVGILRQQSEKTGMDALLALNKKAHELAEQDQGKKTANQRMTFGVYFYAEKEEEQADD